MEGFIAGCLFFVYICILIRVGMFLIDLEAEAYRHNRSLDWTDPAENKAHFTEYLIPFGIGSVVLTLCAMFAMLQTNEVCGSYGSFLFYWMVYSVGVVMFFCGLGLIVAGILIGGSFFFRKVGQSFPNQIDFVSVKVKTAADKVAPIAFNPYLWVVIGLLGCGYVGYNVAQTPNEKCQPDYVSPSKQKQIAWKKWRDEELTPVQAHQFNHIADYEHDCPDEDSDASDD